MTTSSARTEPAAPATSTPAQIYLDRDRLLKAGPRTPPAHYTAEAIAAERGVPRQVAGLPPRPLARQGRIQQSPPGYAAAGTRRAAAPAGDPGGGASGDTPADLRRYRGETVKTPRDREPRRASGFLRCIRDTLLPRHA